MPRQEPSLVTNGTSLAREQEEELAAMADDAESPPADAPAIHDAAQSAPADADTRPAPIIEVATADHSAPAAARAHSADSSSSGKKRSPSAPRPLQPAKIARARSQPIPTTDRTTHWETCDSHDGAHVWQYLNGKPVSREKHMQSWAWDNHVSLAAAAIQDAGRYIPEIDALRYVIVLTETLPRLSGPFKHACAAGWNSDERLLGCIRAFVRFGYLIDTTASDPACPLQRLLAKALPLCPPEVQAYAQAEKLSDVQKYCYRPAIYGYLASLVDDSADAPSLILAEHRHARKRRERELASTAGDRAPPSPQPRLAPSDLRHMLNSRRTASPASASASPGQSARAPTAPADVSSPIPPAVSTTPPPGPSTPAPPASHAPGPAQAPPPAPSVPTPAQALPPAYSAPSMAQPPPFTPVPQAPPASVLPPPPSFAVPPPPSFALPPPSFALPPGFPPALPPAALAPPGPPGLHMFQAAFAEIAAARASYQHFITDCRRSFANRYVQSADRVVTELLSTFTSALERSDEMMRLYEQHLRALGNAAHPGMF